MRNTRLLWSNRTDFWSADYPTNRPPDATWTTSYTANPVIPKTYRANKHFREALGTPGNRALNKCSDSTKLSGRKPQPLASKTQRMAVSTSDPYGFNWANGHSRSLEGWEDYALPMAHRCGTLSSPTPTITWRSWRSWRNQRLEHRS